MEYDQVESLLSILKGIELALEKQNEVKTEFANSVEITNANAKGVKQVTVKGKSDKPLKELITEVNAEYERLTK